MELETIRLSEGTILDVFHKRPNSVLRHLSQKGEPVRLESLLDGLHIRNPCRFYNVLNGLKRRGRIDITMKSGRIYCSLTEVGEGFAEFMPQEIFTLPFSHESRNHIRFLDLRCFFALYPGGRADAEIAREISANQTLVRKAMLRQTDLGLVEKIPKFAHNRPNPRNLTDKGREYAEHLFSSLSLLERLYGNSSGPPHLRFRLRERKSKK